MHSCCWIISEVMCILLRCIPSVAAGNKQLRTVETLWEVWLCTEMMTVTAQLHQAPLCNAVCVNARFVRWFIFVTHPNTNCFQCCCSRGIVYCKPCLHPSILFIITSQFALHSLLHWVCCSDHKHMWCVCGLSAESIWCSVFGPLLCCCTSSL